MASITLTTKTSASVAYLKARCGVRYWEDASVNGVEDEDGSLIPCRIGDDWAPLIEIDTGKVVDWPAGTTAAIHYKVCDDGEYALLDADRNPLRTIEGYVPGMLAPAGGGYGDYVILEVGPDGLIAGWSADLSYFEGD